MPILEQFIESGSVKHLKLYQKLLEIRKNMQYFQKSEKGFNYLYVAGFDVLTAFRETADILGILLIPSIEGMNLTETKVINDKNQEKIGRIINLTLSYNFIDVETGDRITIPWAAYGEQQDSSKAFGSALTYAERYFLLKFFTVPTDKDDPDKKGVNTKEDESENKRVSQMHEPSTGKTEDLAKSIKKGDELSTSHFISDEERELWNKKKSIPESRHRAIDYMMEKIHIGEQVEKSFYIKIMANNKDLSKKESEAQARIMIINEFTPLALLEAKENFKAYLP